MFLATEPLSALLNVYILLILKRLPLCLIKCISALLAGTECNTNNLNCQQCTNENAAVLVSVLLLLLKEALAHCCCSKPGTDSAGLLTDYINFYFSLYSFVTKK